MVIRIETVKWPDLSQLGSCGSSVDAGAKSPSSGKQQQQQQQQHHAGLYGESGSGGTSDSTSTTHDDPVRHHHHQQQQQQQQPSPTGPGQAHAPEMMYSSREVFNNVKRAMAAAAGSGNSSTRNQASASSAQNSPAAAAAAADEVNHHNTNSSSTSPSAAASCSIPQQDSPLHHMWERANNLLVAVDSRQLQTSLEEGKQLFQEKWTALFQNDACVSVVPCHRSPTRFTRRYSSSIPLRKDAQPDQLVAGDPSAPCPPSQQPSPLPEHQQQHQYQHQSGQSSSNNSSASAGKENTFMSTVASLQSKAAAVAAAAVVAVALDEEPPPPMDTVAKQNNLESSAAALKSNPVDGNNNNPRRINTVDSPSSFEDSLSPLSTAQIEVSRDHQVRVIEPVQRPPTTPHHNNNAIPNGTNTPPKSPSSGSRKCKRAPLSLLEVKTEDAAELERSISELTMKSSYGGGESLARIPDNRRMAYYAVGKHHRQSGRGGNRRCYFSGKLILGGAPFYAGAVQQGLRTLVVFCLPSAIGLPDKETIAAHKQKQPHQYMHRPSLPGTSGSNRSLMSNGTTPASVLREHSKADSKGGTSRHSLGSGLPPASGSKRKISINDGHSIASKSGMSRLSSLDDLSLSIDGDLDPNWGLDRDFLLKVLPEPDASILQQIAVLYPEQYETLPIQVRDAARWKLFVKFCFFSGLPIAEGEMHYKVRDEIAEIVYGEEIVLSHDVMEAVNGDVSAELLQLPNQKAFRYLRKHYAQQCNKLDDRVFRRTAWERVAPEV